MSSQVGPQESHEVAQEQPQEPIPEPPPETPHAELSLSNQPQEEQEVSPTQDQSESQLSPEAVASQDTKPASEWPDPSGFESIDKLDLESFPEASRPHFSRIKELYDARLSEWKTERGKIDQALGELEDARGSFHKLIESIDSSGDTKVVSEELDRYKGGFQNLANENIALAQRMFKLENPDFDKYAKEIREKFSNEMADESFYTRYKGDTIYDKMREAWKFTVFRNGAKPVEPAAKPVARTQPVSNVPGNSAQALVADGRRASAMPTPDPEDLSFDDILSLHDHLLRG